MKPVEDIYERAVEEEEEEEEKRVSLLLCGDRGGPKHSRQRRLLVPSVSASRCHMRANCTHEREEAGGWREGGMS